MIACVRIPAFAAALEECADVHLAGQAFALVDGSGLAKTIDAASTGALLAGVRTGMTLRQAQTICPALQLLPANPARAHRVAAEVGEMLAGLTPLVEPEAAPPRLVRGRQRPQPAIGGDEGAAIWFANPGRMLPKQGVAFAESIQAALLRQVKLDAAIGLAANRFTARVAAGAIDPGTHMIVPRDAERDFLASFPVTLLPIYAEQARQLHLLGLDTLGDLAKLPASAFNDLFGGQGRIFKRLVEGRDNTPVSAYVSRLAESLAYQFELPVEDKTVLRGVITGLVERMVLQMERRGQMAGELSLCLMLAGGKTCLEEVALRQPSASTERLVQALAEMLDTMQMTSAVTEVEVTLGRIVEAEARQLSLFPTESVPQDRLREVLRQLIARHGAETFYWADLIDPHARLPERRFHLRQVKAA
jgi:DNA polymerase IV